MIKTAVLLTALCLAVGFAKDVSLRLKKKIGQTNQPANSDTTAEVNNVASNLNLLQVIHQAGWTYDGAENTGGTNYTLLTIQGKTAVKGEDWQVWCKETPTTWSIVSTPINIYDPQNGAEILIKLVSSINPGTDEDELGIWGVDLVNMGADLAMERTDPDSIDFNARDATKTLRLANSAVGYLIQFGFMEAALEKTEKELKDGDTFIGKEDLTKGVRLLQEFYGLPVTGEIDRTTLNHMTKPRCGSKDISYEKPNRAKRYTLSRKRWKVDTLKYWFDPEKYTADLPKDVIRSEFVRALSMWSEVADVSWKEVATESDAHVKITWDYGDHGDGYPFFGPGGSLAHAFYPTKGKLHFDDAEDFTIGTVDGINFHYVATHELGHILGLKHADNSLENAIMYALYTGYSDNLELHQDDIDGAIAVMGAGSGNVVPLGDSTDTGPEPTVIPGPEDIPECIEKIDAAIHWDHDPEYVYLFAGDWYYRLRSKNPDGGNFLPIFDPDSEPKRIGVDGFRGVPRKLDAAVETLEDANRFYAFKGNNYYLYDFLRRNVVRTGTLADLWTADTPAKIESAFKMNQNTLGFIHEDKLYTYNPKSGKKSSWNAGAANSNYLDKFDDLDSISLAFYRSWAWAFRGMYYSVVRSKNGKESSNYVNRLIKPDIKLPMCTDGAGELTVLNSKQKRKCKKEYQKFSRFGSGKTSDACKYYIAKRYNQQVEFSRNDFA